jgi:hypothetical protein
MRVVCSARTCDALFRLRDVRTSDICDALPARCAIGTNATANRGIIIARAASSSSEHRNPAVQMRARAHYQLIPRSYGAVTRYREARLASRDRKT